MARSRGSSNGGDWTDVAGTITAFETINQVRIQVRMTAVPHRGLADLSVEVRAYDRTEDLAEAKPLASVSVTCWGMNFRTLEDAVIRALYKLDGMLAKGEFAKILSS